ncbi:DNA repair protein [Xaviernesmea oryzae]|uniref:DNA repair protein n=1 Tax=Xaviernesmea oryzae TaxID=464029 RepID=A0A1Q9AZG2_9HYPH|nr:alpha-ketoglutarate-dependent dioxygenase AlkB [Xaviernesmea oryzae]OLP61080.1 DNA repair protein [Xaviernesmea oryzae]SEL14119.1 Alkylated DNA repair dioxygenase AlkB [Xaviernesmea oryzae]
MDHALNAAALPPGVTYVRDVLSSEEEQVITDKLDAATWSNVLKRRVQHFGYIYDYKARTVSAEAYLGALPAWLGDLADRLLISGHVSALPDQVIANEYLPGQGISAHVDCVPCFGQSIASISLLSPCEMIFRERGGSRSLAVTLHPRSCIVLTGAGRYDWTHEIPARKSDIVDGAKAQRGRRISLTFRKVTPPAVSTMAAL